MPKHDTYFIGYDAREHEAACVAAYSLKRRSNRRTHIYMLEHQSLRKMDLFHREWSIGSNGQFYDLHDERPFSTAFSHSRFLVFHLARELKCTGPCMFLDCDWLFLDDPGSVMALQAEIPEKIGVVNRTRVVAENSSKMDGMVQQNYSRKLWSAMFTFMPDAIYPNLFTPDTVDTEAGRDLHAFLGLNNDHFWSIDPAWHYIPSLDPVPTGGARGIHYSEFSPWLNPEKYSAHPKEFDAWFLEKDRWLNFAAAQGKLEVWDNLELALSGAKA